MREEFLKISTSNRIILRHSRGVFVRGLVLAATLIVLVFNTFAYRVIINEFSDPRLSSGWIELKCLDDDGGAGVDVSSWTVTDLDGAEAPLSSAGSVTMYATDLPATPWDDRFVVVHWGVSGDDEVDGSGDLNENGVRDIYLGGPGFGSADQMVIDTDTNYSNGGFVDAVVFTNGSAYDLSDVDNYLVPAGQWVVENGLCSLSDTVDLSPYKLGVYVARDTISTDTNTKFDWHAVNFSTPGSDNEGVGSAADGTGVLESYLPTSIDPSVDTNFSLVMRGQIAATVEEVALEIPDYWIWSWNEDDVVVSGSAIKASTRVTIDQTSRRIILNGVVLIPTTEVQVNLYGLKSPSIILTASSEFAQFKVLTAGYLGKLTKAFVCPVRVGKRSWKSIKIVINEFKKGDFLELYIKDDGNNGKGVDISGLQVCVNSTLVKLVENLVVFSGSYVVLKNNVEDSNLANPVAYLNFNRSYEWRDDTSICIQDDSGKILDALLMSDYDGNTENSEFQRIWEAGEWKCFADSCAVSVKEIDWSSQSVARLWGAVDTNRASDFRVTYLVSEGLENKDVGFPKRILINEVKFKGEDQFIELKALEDGNFKEYRVCMGNTVLKVLPDVEIPRNTYIVLWLKNGLDELDASDGVVNLYTNFTALNPEDGQIVLYDNQGGIMDAVCYSNGDLTETDTAFVDWLVQKNAWFANFGYEAEYCVDSNISEECAITRNELANDTNTKNDWYCRYPTAGKAANVLQTAVEIKATSNLEVNTNQLYWLEFWVADAYGKPVNYPAPLEVLTSNSSIKVSNDALTWSNKVEVMPSGKTGVWLKVEDLTDPVFVLIRDTISQLGSVKVSITKYNEADILVTELMAEPPNGWSKSNLTWIEIYNYTTKEVDLASYKLRVKSITGDVVREYSLPALTLRPGEVACLVSQLEDDDDADGVSFSTFYGNRDGVWDEKDGFRAWQIDGLELEENSILEFIDEVHGKRIALYIPRGKGAVAYKVSEPADFTASFNDALLSKFTEYGNPGIVDNLSIGLNVCAPKVVDYRNKLIISAVSDVEPNLYWRIGKYNPTLQKMVKVGDTWQAVFDVSSWKDSTFEFYVEAGRERYPQEGYAKVLIKDDTTQLVLLMSSSQIAKDSWATLSVYLQGDYEGSELNFYINVPDGIWIDDANAQRPGVQAYVYQGFDFQNEYSGGEFAFTLQNRYGFKEGKLIDIVFKVSKNSEINDVLEFNLVSDVNASKVVVKVLEEGSAYITYEGGVVFGPYSSSLTIPPAALDSGAEISIKRLSLNEVPSVNNLEDYHVKVANIVYGLYPDDIEFLKPCVFSIYITSDELAEAGIGDSETLILYRWFENEGKWIAVDTLRVTRSGYYTADISKGGLYVVGSGVVSYTEFAFSGLEVYPRVFNPDEIDLSGELKFQYFVSFPARVEFKIYNSRGIKVKEFTVNAVAGVNTAWWDGRDNGGKVVKSGIYIVVAKAYDESSGKYIRQKKAFVIKRNR